MQNHYNLLHREEEREMLPLCADLGVGVIPWSPLARGRLTRDWDATTARSETDEFGRALYGEGDREIVDAVARVAERRGVSRAQVALAWVSRHRTVAAPIVGATKPEHIDDAVASLAITLTDDEVKRARGAIHSAGHRRVRVTPEVEQLLATLEAQRAGVVKKLAGLSTADARRSTVGSGTNLAGLMQHLTFVESLWFEERVAGRKASRGKRSMDVDRSVTLRALRAEYRAACNASNAIVTALGDADVSVIGSGTARDLRSVLLVVIGETARHAGHADIIREQIDGQTGR